MKNNLYRLVCFCLFFGLTINTYSQNLKLSTESQLKKLSQKTAQINDELGFSETDIPSSHSMKKYCPSIIEQEGSSCVGFSVAYAAASITHNYINNMTEWNHKMVNIFDPYYIYSSIKEDDIECATAYCDCGTWIWDALDVMIDYGCKKMDMAPFLNCQNNLSKKNLLQIANRTMAYTIDNYYILAEPSEEVDVDLIKSFVANNYPIITALYVDDSFDRVGKVGSNYTPNANASNWSGHAVTIIGYDDYKNGGSFEIMNSYGEDWGNDGYFWMSYKDFKNYCAEAYAFYNEDWSSWYDSFSNGDYYKGYGGGDFDDWYYEAIVNEEGWFHGSVILTTPEGVGVGDYNNGYMNGYWYMLPNEGGIYEVLFNNGEFIEETALGFSESDMSTNTLEEDYNLDIFNLETEKGNENDYNKEEKKGFQEKMSVKTCYCSEDDGAKQWTAYCVQQNWTCEKCCDHTKPDKKK